MAAGKRARDETDISKGAVSISSAAYELAAERAPLDSGRPRAGERARAHRRRGQDDPPPINAHGVAARRYVGRKCTILNRSYQRAKDMADEYKAWHRRRHRRRRVRLDDSVASQLAKDADIIFTASSAIDYIFDAENIGKLDRQAGREKLMLVDTPSRATSIPLVTSWTMSKAYDVDSLKAVVERNTAKRRREIVEAEKLLEEEHACIQGLDHFARCRARHHETPDQGRGFEAGGIEARGQETAVAFIARDRRRRKIRPDNVVKPRLHGPPCPAARRGSTDDKKNASSALTRCAASERRGFRTFAVVAVCRRARRWASRPHLRGAVSAPSCVVASDSFWPRVTAPDGVRSRREGASTPG